MEQPIHDEPRLRQTLTSSKWHHSPQYTHITALWPDFDRVFNLLTGVKEESEESEESASESEESASESEESASESEESASESEEQSVNHSEQIKPGEFDVTGWYMLDVVTYRKNGEKAYRYSRHGRAIEQHLQRITRHDALCHQKHQMQEELAKHRSEVYSLSEGLEQYGNAVEPAKREPEQAHAYNTLKHAVEAVSQDIAALQEEIRLWENKR